MCTIKFDYNIYFGSEVYEMSMKINLGAWNSIFAVPSSVVDEGLKFSDGVKLKVLLYLLRHSGEDVNESDISKATGVNETDIPEAVEYWVMKGIFCLNNGTFEPAQAEQQTTEQPAVKQVESNNTAAPFEKEEPTVPHMVVRPQRPDYVYVAQQLAVDEDFKMLVNEAQTALGKPLSNSDASSLLLLKNTCGLPVEVIIMLIQYCISIGKSNIRAIETIGLRWSDAGVFSIEEAENKIKQAHRASQSFTVVASAFGLKNTGSPTKKQVEYADLWVNEWKFSPEMLREAYERCVDSKGSCDFRYINGILKRWNSSGIYNVDDLNKFDSRPDKYKNKGGNRNNANTSYNINDLQRLDTIDSI